MTDMLTYQLHDLPQEISIFPLPGAILLPRVDLPLNIFEPRYLAMVDEAMRGTRLIGMIQSQAAGGGIYKTGCAGRIVSYAETTDGRYMITLKGVCRFKVVQELPVHAGGFRRVAPDWQGFSGDLSPEPDGAICRDALTSTLSAYLKRTGMSCDQWQAMRQISCDRLISTLSVICPFGVEEKQALLEAKDLKERAYTLQAIMEIANRTDTESKENGGCGACH